jgi:hypothetical protein
LGTSLVHEDVGVPAAPPYVSVAPLNFDQASPEFGDHSVGQTLTATAVRPDEAESAITARDR